MVTVIIPFHSEKIKKGMVYFMKLPNGYGSIARLSGNRRKPWRVRKTVGWMLDEEKQMVKQLYKTIGYFGTRSEALQALAEFNANPFDIDPTITFEEVYARWSQKKFAEVAKSNIAGYQSAFKLCAEINQMKFVDIKLQHLQGVVDSSGKNYPILKKLKTLFNQLFDYAVQHEIISKDKHLVEYLDIGKEIPSDKHYRFTDAELETIWQWSEGNEYVQVILMLIYSGVRPGELFNLKSCNVNLSEKWFKVEKGKTVNAARKVPIHERVFPFFQHWMSKGNEYLVTQLNGGQILFDTNHGQFTESYWKPLLLDMGILDYINEKGERRQHTPDDTRHTFTTMWKEAKLDEAFRRKIQGHSGKGIGEVVYTHLEFEKLRTELNQLK